MHTLWLPYDFSRMTPVATCGHQPVQDQSKLPIVAYWDRRLPVGTRLPLRPSTPPMSAPTTACRLEAGGPSRCAGPYAGVRSGSVHCPGSAGVQPAPVVAGARHAANGAARQRRERAGRPRSQDAWSPTFHRPWVCSLHSRDQQRQRDTLLVASLMQDRKPIADAYYN